MMIASYPYHFAAMALFAGIFLGLLIAHFTSQWLTNRSTGRLRRPSRQSQTTRLPATGDSSTLWFGNGKPDRCEGCKGSATGFAYLPCTCNSGDAQEIECLPPGDRKLK